MSVERVVIDRGLEFGLVLGTEIPDSFVEFMVEAVRSHSTQLQLDPSGSKVRANHKRCVVVLREIDKDTPVDEIMSIFSACAAQCLHCEFAGNRSWYLSFKDELEAQIAVQFLKEEVQTFKGESLFARIKTHPIPRANARTSVDPAVPPAAIKSPLLSTRSDQTDDDLSTADLVSPPAFKPAHFGDSSAKNSTVPNQFMQQSQHFQYPATPAYPYGQEAYKYYLNSS